MTKFNFVVLNAAVVLLFVKNAEWSHSYENYNAYWLYYSVQNRGLLYDGPDSGVVGEVTIFPHLGVAGEVSISKKLFEGY